MAVGCACAQDRGIELTGAPKVYKENTSNTPCDCGACLSCFDALGLYDEAYPDAFTREYL